MRVHFGHRSAMTVATILALILSACGMMQKEETQAAAEEAKPLTDAEIVAVLSTLNRGEITQAEVALERSTDPQVREVAQRMLSEHLTMQRRTESLAQTANIQPEENELSRSIYEQAQQMSQQLQDASGSKFDNAYLEGQAQMHQLAVDTVRNELLPAAQNPQLKDMLQTAAPNLEAHLKHAEKAQEELNQG